MPYWALAIGFALAFTALNLRGVKTSARINDVLAAGMSIVVVIFFVFVIRFVWQLHTYGPGFFTQPFYNPATFSFGGVLRGTSIAVLTYIGFDAISTFSEEVENPRRNILLATVLVCVITGVLASLEVYAAQLVWGSQPFAADKVESAFPLVAQRAGGYLLFQLVNFTILIANVGSGMGSQLGAARLLYGMGRSDGIPKKFFGALDPKNHIPRNNVIFVGAIALVGAFLITYDQGAQLLNFGALLAFMGVNAAAFVRYFLRAKERNWFDFFSPVSGFVICFCIWCLLSEKAILLGVVWMAVGIAYGAVKTKGFQADLVKFDIPSDEV
jgi:amino acid transporter